MIKARRFLSRCCISSGKKSTHTLPGAALLRLNGGNARGWLFSSTRIRPVMSEFMTLLLKPRYVLVFRSSMSVVLVSLMICELTTFIRATAVSLSMARTCGRLMYTASLYNASSSEDETVGIWRISWGLTSSRRSFMVAKKCVIIEA